MNKDLHHAARNDPAKVYVDVSVVFTRKGVMLPRSIAWENGRVYQISKVKSIRRIPDQNTHRYYLCYACIVCGQDAELYYDGNFRWFLHRRVPASKTVE